MKMKKDLKWRLSKLPTATELRELVKDKIITQEEARQILFSEDTKVEKSNKDLESEVKFLRELVDKLSENKVTEIVKYVEGYYPRYRRWDWFQPYYNYCVGDNAVLAVDNNPQHTLLFQ